MSTAEFNKHPWDHDTVTGKSGRCQPPKKTKSKFGYPDSDYDDDNSDVISVSDSDDDDYSATHESFLIPSLGTMEGNGSTQESKSPPGFNTQPDAASRRTSHLLVTTDRDERGTNAENKSRRVSTSHSPMDSFAVGGVRKESDGNGTFDKLRLSKAPSNSKSSTVRTKKRKTKDKSATATQQQRDATCASESVAKIKKKTPTPTSTGKKQRQSKKSSKVDSVDDLRKPPPIPRKHAPIKLLEESDDESLLGTIPFGKQKQKSALEENHQNVLAATTSAPRTAAPLNALSVTATSKDEEKENNDPNASSKFLATLGTEIRSSNAPLVSDRVTVTAHDSHLPAKKRRIKQATEEGTSPARKKKKSNVSQVEDLRKDPTHSDAETTNAVNDELQVHDQSKSIISLTAIDETAQVSIVKKTPQRPQDIGGGAPAKSTSKSKTKKVNEGSEPRSIYRATTPKTNKAGTEKPATKVRSDTKRAAPKSTSVIASEAASDVAHPVSTNNTGESTKGVDHLTTTMKASCHGEILAEITHCKSPAQTKATTADDTPKLGKKDVTTKKKKRTFQDEVLYHMVAAMKPFDLRSLARALNVTEQQLSFTMLSMEDKTLVLKKEFVSVKSRSKVLYWANLDSKCKEAVPLECSPEKLKAAAQELRNVASQEVHLQEELAQIMSQPCTKDLAMEVEKEEGQIVQLRQQLEATRARIEAAKDNPIMPTSVGMNLQKPKSAAELSRERCPRRMKMRINAMREEWKKRKQKCADFVDVLADGMEKKPKDLLKLLDLETDEMCGAVLPAKYDIDK